MGFSDRIKKVGKGDFRVRLYLEDVIPEATLEMRGETIGVFHSNPIPHGNIGPYYHRKLSSMTSDYAVRLVTHLVYINEGIDELGMRRLTEYCLNNFIQYTSEHGYFIKHEKFKEFFENVYLVKSTAGWTELELLYSSIVLYSKQSELDGDTKRSISASLRGARTAALAAEMIHNATMMAIETEHPKLRLGPKVILPFLESVKSMDTFRKHLSGETKDLIGIENLDRVFTTKGVVEKFLTFQTLPTLSTRALAKRLSISLSTVKQFKEIQ